MAVREYHPRKNTRTKRKRPERKIDRNNRRKMIISFSVLFGFICILIGRLIAINVSNTDKYTKIVLAQMDYDSQTIPFKRGNILDRNGTVMATSEKVYNLVLDPYVVNNSVVDCKNAVAEALNAYFDIETGKVYSILEEQPDSRYVVLKKELSYDEYKAYQDYVNPEETEETKEQETSESETESGSESQTQTAKKDTDIPTGAIWFEEDYVRQYPYDTMAADLVGFTVKGNVGTWGIEGYYNEQLNGTDGREYGYLSDSTGFERTTIPAVNGYNVVSTIDLNIQRIVEKYLLQLEQERGSKNAGVIVANPNNGEILAMASTPTFDLNNPRDISKYYSDEEVEAMDDEEVVNIYNQLWRNFCVSDTYEAGSTMKPLTIGAGLDEASVSPEDTFYCDGGEDLFDGTGTQHIACHNIYGHGTVTLQQAIMWSCNDSLMQIGNKIGVTNMLKYHRLYGFGQKTGIDLPGEASGEGLVFNEDTMHNFELATSSFGQGFNITMVQMVASFSSIVNGGHYYQPHAVKEINADSGKIVKSFDKVLVKNTFSKETCEFLKEAMYQTVSDDGSYTTGTAARVDGYKIGGKTGTAEKVPRGNGKYVVSFIGFAPVDDPQIVVYVVIDELQDNQEDSGAPTKMAGLIIKEVLPYLQIFPEDGTQLDTPYQWTAGETNGTGEDNGEGDTQDTPPESLIMENNTFSGEEGGTENGNADTGGEESSDEWSQQGWTDEDGDGIPDQWD